MPPVDDPMIEEALEDFASDNDDDGNEDKDSDFQVEGEEESGSDWEKSKSGSQKNKVAYFHSLMLLRLNSLLKRQ